MGKYIDLAPHDIEYINSRVGEQEHPSIEIEKYRENSSESNDLHFVLNLPFESYILHLK